MPMQQWRYTANWSDPEPVRIQVVNKVFNITDRGTSHGVVEAEDFLHASRLALADAKEKLDGMAIDTLTVHAIDDEPNATERDVQLVLFQTE